MKTLGMIGGVGPESTVDYYLSILKAYQERRPDGPVPSIIINSIDLNKLRGFFEADDRKSAAIYLAAEVKKLSAAGADFGMISASTPHLVFDQVQRESSIPLVSMVRATCQAARKLVLTNVGLLGTRFIMRATLYPEAFAKDGIATVTPNGDEQQYIHEKYFGELVKGIFLSETRERILGIIKRMTQQEQIQGVVLAGTELPLLLRNGPAPGIPYLDTTKIHVTAAVEELLS